MGTYSNGTWRLDSPLALRQGIVPGTMPLFALFIIHEFFSIQGGMLEARPGIMAMGLLALGMLPIAHS